MSKKMSLWKKSSKNKKYKGKKAAREKDILYAGRWFNNEREREREKVGIYIE